jgi:hypothetical protein
VVYIRRFIALATAFGLAACTSATTPTAVVIHFPARSFARPPRGSAVVPFTVTNVGMNSVLLTSRCGDHLSPAIERRGASGWQQYSGGYCLAINPMSAVPLAAGASRDDGVIVVESGDYRLVLGTDRGSVVSGAFAIQ